MIEISNAEKGKVVVRFAPNPSGYLHIGHARAAILNDEIAKQYNGKLILRIEDTDPGRVDEEAYSAIEDDLKWLGVDWDIKIIQSDRLMTYENFAEQLIEQGNAYVCNCEQEKFKSLKSGKMSCPHRNLSIEENLKNFERMHTEDGLTVRIKTNLNEPNPSLVDFPLLRTSKEIHPRLKNKNLTLYPLMNLSVAVDDHLLGITHVLRGKDHLTNTEKQKFIYKYFGWNEPNFIHYGIMSIGSEGKISKSEIKKGIDEGKFIGWDDVNLLTLRALKKRGINPQAIRNYMLNLGIKDVDIEFSEEALYFENKKFIESSFRYFFIEDQVGLTIENFPNMLVKFPLHKEHTYGFRTFNLVPENNKIGLLIQKSDTKKLKEGDEIRLMNTCNVRITKTDVTTGNIIADYVEDSHGPMVEINGKNGEKKKFHNISKVLWLPEKENLPVKIYLPERTVAGVCELVCKNLKENTIIQFETFGFCRVDKIKGDMIEFYFTQR
ncbi:Glutamate--tRNA ligase [groundwater metagenome]|uniref:glutamate--tRNA ligase n=1 Tax=groundwater metagenome TaxID=717931 RepID=A0A098E9K4_9ZZZZ